MIKEASKLTGKYINNIKSFIENNGDKSPKRFQKYQTINKPYCVYNFGKNTSRNI